MVPSLVVPTLQTFRGRMLLKVPTRELVPDDFGRSVYPKLIQFEWGDHRHVRRVGSWAL